MSTFNDLNNATAHITSEVSPCIKGKASINISHASLLIINNGKGFYFIRNDRIDGVMAGRQCWEQEGNKETYKAAICLVEWG